MSQCSISQFSLNSPSSAAVLALCCAGFVSNSWAKIAQPTEPYISYTVQEGDKLLSVAQKLLANPKAWNELARLNGLANPNLISIGLVIDVPSSMVNFAAQPKLANQGTIQSASGQVSVNGQPAKVGDTVPEGAKVQTAQSSSATVKLSDGSTVQLMPRTLAEITTQHGYALKDPTSSISTTWYSGAIRLVEGLLDLRADKTAKRKEPLQVITPTSVVGVRGTEFRVAFEDLASGAARTEVLEGKVRADNAKQGVGAEVGGGFGAAMLPNEREIKVVQLLPALPESALPASIKRSLESKQALWTVSALSGASAYRAELAQDAGFANIVLDTKSSSSALDFSRVPNGEYYARVRGVDALGLEGYNAARRIQISDTAPRLVWVREVQVSAFADYTPEGVLLRVNMAASDTPRQLQLQVANDEAFTQGVQSFTVDSNARVVLPGIAAGQTRFLRFSGNTAQGTPGTSPTLRLELPGNWGSTVFGLNGALQPLK